MPAVGLRQLIWLQDSCVCAGSKWLGEGGDSWTLSQLTGLLLKMRVNLQLLVLLVGTYQPTSELKDVLKYD